MTLLRRLIRQSRTLRRVQVLSLLVAVYAMVVYLGEFEGPLHIAEFPGELATALSFVLGLILVFRTNRAYERWWEARTLWGNLVNASRNLAVKARAVGRSEADEIADLRRLIVAFPVALRDHLRDGAILSTLPGFEHATERPDHVPSFLAGRIFDRLHAWQRRGLMGGDDMIVLDRESRILLDVAGGCERIRNTPTPISYRLFAGFAVFGYLVVLPWALVETLRVWMVPAVCVFAYFMIGLEMIAHSIEAPFGVDEDDLDMDRCCEAIRASVDEILAPEAPPVRLAGGAGGGGDLRTGSAPARR